MGVWCRRCPVPSRGNRSGGREVGAGAFRGFSVWDGSGPRPVPGAPLSGRPAAGYSGSMSVIVSEVYDALLEAGASEEKAKAAAAAIPLGGQVATKQDVLELKADLAVLKFAVFTFIPLILALLIKLVFFP